MNASEMEEAGIGSFDEWASNFTEPKTEQEYTVEGTYRDVTRLARWSNRRALFGMYRNFTDVKTREDLPNLPIPPHAHHVSADNAGSWMPGFMDNVRKRAVAIRTGQDENGRKITPDIDNFLKLTTDARKAALDPRLVDPNAPDEPNSKINRCVRNVLDTYRSSHGELGTQLIFADMGTPKAESKTKPKVVKNEDDAEANIDEAESGDVLNELESSAQHSVYTDIKRKLIEAGIPAEEIAFAHEFDTDEKKRQRNERMNTGKLRVLIGSTEKMGAGLNVQKRLYALHHLDCPWRPRDLEQREGRIIRQGNGLFNRAFDHLKGLGYKDADIDFAHPEQARHLADAGLQAKVFRYVTKATLDEYLWQTVKEKSDYIAKAKKGLDLDADMDDIDPVTADYSAVMGAASDNPLVKEKGEVWREIKRLRGLRDSHLDETTDLARQLRYLPNSVQRLENEATAHDGHAERLVNAAQNWEAGRPDKFAMQIGKQRFDGAKETLKAREAAGESLFLEHDEKARNIRRGSSVEVGKYGPFAVHVAPHPYEFGKFYGQIHDADGQHLASFEQGASHASTTTRMDNAINNLGEEAFRHQREAKHKRDEAKRLLADGPRLEEMSKAKWPHDEALAEKEKRLIEIEAKLSGEEERKKAAEAAQPALEELQPAETPSQNVVRGISKALGLQESVDTGNAEQPSKPLASVSGPDFETPGYFLWGTTVLARRVARGESAQFWNGSTWTSLGDESDFRKQAKRITPQEAEYAAGMMGIRGAF